MNHHPDDYQPPSRDEVLKRRLQIAMRLAAITQHLSDPDSRCNCMPIEVRIRINLLDDNEDMELLVAHDQGCRQAVDHQLANMEAALFGG